MIYDGRPERERERRSVGLSRGIVMLLNDTEHEEDAADTTSRRSQRMRIVAKRALLIFCFCVPRSSVCVRAYHLLLIRLTGNPLLFSPFSIRSGWIYIDICFSCTHGFTLFCGVSMTTILYRRWYLFPADSDPRSWFSCHWISLSNLYRRGNTGKDLKRIFWSFSIYYAPAEPCLSIWEDMIPSS